jgi:deferrochelatase/peroxidase EfeB
MTRTLTKTLDLSDIQGNILSSYGHQRFPRARYLFLHVAKAAAGRDFINAYLPKVTTALRWESSKDYPGEILKERPEVAYNFAFNYCGLKALGVPTATLRAMPTEFIDGMAARAHILGDQPERTQGEEQPAVPPFWDRIWRDSQGDLQVHILMSLNVAFDAPANALEIAYTEVIGFCGTTAGGVTLLSGHGPTEAFYQDASVLLQTRPDGSVDPSRREHFGFSDGFGDPVFEGQYPAASLADESIGSGKVLPDQTWAALATGEFLLGYPDEAQEVPGQFYPFAFTRNGTFMAYRKLHENVASFQNYIAATAQVYAQAMSMPNTPASLDEAQQTIMAKMGGRWQNGVPLMIAPTYAEAVALDTRVARAEANHDQKELASLQEAYVNFIYHDDPLGVRCPVTAHMRRANPRDGLDPTGNSPNPNNWNGSVLNNRRRILRRGLPYGASDPSAPSDSAEHGIIFMAVCASLSRQFEFVQQQWIQYGLDFNAGNDTCPLLGNHDSVAKFVIPADPASPNPPFFCAQVPQLVEVRGGDYFFVPSLSALRMLGMGIIDPT